MHFVAEIFADTNTYGKKFVRGITLNKIQFLLASFATVKNKLLLKISSDSTFHADIKNIILNVIRWTTNSYVSVIKVFLNVRLTNFTCLNLRPKMRSIPSIIAI